MADSPDRMSISSDGEERARANSFMPASNHPASIASTPLAALNEHKGQNTSSIFGPPHTDTQQQGEADAVYFPSKSKGKRRAGTPVDGSPTGSTSASPRKKVRIASPSDVADTETDTATGAEQDLDRGASQDTHSASEKRFSPFAQYFHAPRVTTSKGKRRASSSPDSSHISTTKTSTTKRARLLATEDEFAEPTITSTNTGQEGTATKTSASPQQLFPLPRVTIPADVLRAIFHPHTANSQQQPNTNSTKGNEPFDLLGRIMSRPELILCLVSWLLPADLLSLYSISKPFHWLMNSHFTTYIKAILRRRAPYALECFPFRWYRTLCVIDPVWRLRAAAEARLAAQGLDSGQAQIRDIRMVPGFRYLQMVVNRHKVAAEIMKELWSRELKLPRGTFKTLFKCWFVMDIARNGLRIAVIHNRQYWTDQDLFFASHFFMKFEMACADPVDSKGERALSRLFLGLPTLTCMRNLLRGDYCWWDVLRFKVCYDYVPQPQHRHLPIFGIPPHLVGRFCMEGWGQGNSRLMRVDELVMREAIRRNIHMNQHYLNFMMYGFWLDLDWLEKNEEDWTKFKAYKSWRASKLVAEMEKLSLRDPIIEGMDY
jgi:hypothetical protein